MINPNINIGFDQDSSTTSKNANVNQIKMPFTNVSPVKRHQKVSMNKKSKGS